MELKSTLSATKRETDGLLEVTSRKQKVKEPAKVGQHASLHWNKSTLSKMRWKHPELAHQTITDFKSLWQRNRVEKHRGDCQLLWELTFIALEKDWQQ